MENTTNLELLGVLGIVSENAESILTYSENTRKVRISAHFGEYPQKKNIAVFSLFAKSHNIDYVPRRLYFPALQ